MPHDATSPGADRCPDRNLSLPRRTTCEQEVRDVRARDEQYQSDGAHQEPECWSHAAGDRELQGIDRGTTPNVVIRIRSLEISHDPGHVSPPRLERDAIAQTRDHAEIVLSTARRGFIVLQRDPNAHVGEKPKAGGPDLGLDGVLGGAEEAFDLEVLLDPFEEQLDLPAAFVKLGDGERRHGEVVGQEGQGLAGFRIVEFDAAELIGVARGRTDARGNDCLIAPEPGSHADLRTSAVNAQTMF